MEGVRQKCPEIATDKFKILTVKQDLPDIYVGILSKLSYDRRRLL